MVILTNFYAQAESIIINKLRRYLYDEKNAQAKLHVKMEVRI